MPLVPGRRLARVDAHARCAADAEGQALCWGHEYREEREIRKPWPDARVTLVAGDPENEAFCALRRDGHALCQGDPDFGARGNGGRDSTARGPVDAAVRFTQLAVLWKWVCGLDERGAALCWGAAGYGDARAGQSREGFERCERWGVHTWCNRRPAPVAGGLRFRSLVPLPHGTMPVVYRMAGITADGRAFVWGGDRRPRPWHPEHRWRSLSAADWGECGVTTRGVLFCWGRDPHDQVRGRIAHPD